MTYQERKSIILAIATLLVSIIYYTVFKEKFITPNLEQAELLKQWAKFIIIFIPVQIVINIIFTIISYIATNISDTIQQGGEPVENNFEIVDELDKQIDLKSLQVSTTIFALSVISGIATLIFYAPVSIMFNIFFFGIVLTGVAMEISKLYFYRRGFKMKKKKINNNIRRLRFENDEMTQQELASRIGVTRQAILSIEKCKYLPSLELAFDIAKEFNLPIEEIFFYEDKE